VLSRVERQAALVVVMLIVGVGMVLVYLLTNDNQRVSSDARVQETNIARGQEIFAANCATCHGNKGQGGVGLPLNIPANHPTGDAATSQRDTYLERTLHNGRVGTYMAPWGQENGGPLNSEQINAVVTMIMYGDWNQTAQVVDEYYLKQKSTLAPPQGQLAINTGGVGGNPSLATKGPFPSGVQNPTPGAGAAAQGGSTDTTAAGAPAKFIGDGHTVNVELKDFVITLDTSLVKPGMTTFNIKNAGPSPHNFGIKDQMKYSETIDAGKTTQLKLDLQAGGLTGICNIAGHEQLGMKVALTVGDMEPPAAAAAPVGMAAAGGGPTNMGVAPSGTINAQLADFTIKQDYSTVKAGTVTIVVKNMGPSPHNYQIAGNGVMQASKTLDSGATEMLKVDLKPGTYTVICNIPGHEQLGMKTTLIVQ